MAKRAGKTTDKDAAPPKKSTTRKAVAKKATAKKKVTAKKAAVKKKVVARKGGANPSATTRQISADERRRMIAEAAYLRAESQGFLSDDLEDWLVAEAEVDAQLVKATVEVYR
jgi:hypothetical protein